MPYIITEPQKIEGTKLGYAIYPYQFSFEDHFKVSGDRKLVIFELSDAPRIDVIGVLHEETYDFQNTHRGDVEFRIMKYVESHSEFVKDKVECGAYFERVKNECFHKEIDEKRK